jgi:hypothetical protein
MEQATTERTASRQAGTKEKSPVVQRVSDLRKRAKEDTDAVREETWTWFKELGKARDEDGLNQLFALGQAPKELDGPTDGILVVPLIQGVLDQGLSLITSIWMPWMGKRFDAANDRGDNLLTESAHWPAKLLWPRYSTKEIDDADGRAAFEFKTYVEPGKHDPDTDVLVIDYEPVSDNPDLLIRKIRDELVEIAAGAHLGKILYRTGEDDYRNLGFFALRPPS